MSHFNCLLMLFLKQREKSHNVKVQEFVPLGLNLSRGNLSWVRGLVRVFQALTR